MSHPIPNDPSQAISIRGLVKTYHAKFGVKEALKGIDLDIPRGSFFALLGPNGAGKSTLINILAGLVIKTQGEVRIWDIDIDQEPRRARAAIGIVPQELNLDAFFTPLEALEFQAGLYGVPKRERRSLEILEALGLADKANAYARTLSGGMRRRLLVAKALMHQPPILVLDEPTAGVDIELRQQLWAYVRQLNAQGVTVLLTTHYLEEAEKLCDHVAIINHGQLVAYDRTDRLLNRLDFKTVLLTLGRPMIGTPPSLAPYSPAMRPDGRLALSFRKSQASMGVLLTDLAAANLEITDLSTEEPDLEDLFLELTRSH